MILNKTIIVFGKGNILVSPMVGMETGIGKILFDELEKPVKIGTKFKNLNIDNLPHPVEFVFEKTESIDALIEGLMLCKKDMIKFQKKENKNGK